MNNSQGSNQQVYCPRSATHCWACLISPWLEVDGDPGWDAAQVYCAALELGVSDGAEG